MKKSSASHPLLNILKVSEIEPFYPSIMKTVITAIALRAFSVSAYADDSEPSFLFRCDKFLKQLKIFNSSPGITPMTSGRLHGKTGPHPGLSLRNGVAQARGRWWQIRQTQDRPTVTNVFKCRNRVA